MPPKVSSVLPVILVIFSSFCALSLGSVFQVQDINPPTDALEPEPSTGVEAVVGAAPFQPYLLPSWKINGLLAISDEVEVEPVCDTSSSIGDFPDDIFTREQRQNGAIVLHIFAAFYFFTFLAVVCNDYFLPSVECICEDLQITPDVAAATFMAVSGAIPEFFTNMISTFITKSGLGLGAVIGTLFFNTLGVAACAGIATKKPVQLQWYPLARDCLIFGVAVSMLTAMSWDGLIHWYEALILALAYVVYWIVLFQNTRMKKAVDKLGFDKWWCCSNFTYDLEQDAEKEQPQTKDGELKVEPSFQQKDLDGVSKNVPLRKMSIRLQFSAIQNNISPTANADAASEETKEPHRSLWTIPRKSTIGTIWFFYVWPLRLLTTLTVPDPKTNRRWYPLTFIMCIVYIGGNAYLIFWMMVVMGDTWGIPEVIMGLTILCWGSCLPEAIACIIVIRRGSGGVGVSNSLGSNTMAILFSLGLPWLIKTAVDGAWTTPTSAIDIYSHGINFIICSILFAILTLFLILSGFKYRLKKTIGLVLLLAYSVFLTLSLLLELNVIFPSPDGCI